MMRRLPVFSLLDCSEFDLLAYQGHPVSPPQNVIPVSPQRKTPSVANNLSANNLPAAQNAPPPISGGNVQGSNSPVDQSETFFGGQHHPWRRYFARWVDLGTGGLLLLVLLRVAAYATMPEQAERLMQALDTLDNPALDKLLASVLLCLVWLPVEAAFLSSFGGTPAKWLFGIRVARPDGSLLSFSEALKRSFLVWIQGLGFGVPLIMQIMQLFAYRRLTKTGATSWDSAANAVVFHEKWKAFRAFLCTVAVLGVLLLIGALNVPGNQR
jgi:uncharacterized RDD family membrane protein YckC